MNKCHGIISLSTWQQKTEQEKNEIRNAIEQGKSFDGSDHEFNMVTFSDGSSYMVDMTIKDGGGDKSEGCQYSYMTDAKHFGCALAYDDTGLRAISDGEQRQAALNCKQMPRADIEQAQQKALQELPYIAALQELDQMQKDNNFTKEKTSALYKMKMNFDKFMDKMFGPKTDLLPSGADDIIKNNIESMLDSQDKIQSDNIQQHQQSEIVNSDMVMNREEEVQLDSMDANRKENDTPTNSYQNDFRAMIAGNGQYRKNVEEYMNNYQSGQKDNKDRVLEEDELEI